MNKNRLSFGNVNSIYSKKKQTYLTFVKLTVGKIYLKTTKCLSKQ